MNSKDSIAHIATLNSVEAVQAFVGEDTRSTVVEAGQKRIAQLTAGDDGATDEDATDNTLATGDDAADGEEENDEEGEEEQEEDDEEEEEQPAPTKEPAAQSTPSTSAPAKPAPKEDTMSARVAGHREQAGKAKPAFTEGKGNTPKPVGKGAYKVVGSDGNGKGMIITAHGSFLRSELEKDQALCAKLHAAGSRAIKKI